MRFYAQGDEPAIPYRLEHYLLHAKTLGQSWLRGLGSAQRLYPRHSGFI